MKPIIFTNHALKRIKERSGLEKYAEKIFRKAEKIHQGIEVSYYRNGRFRFIVREEKQIIKIITVIKD